jgi:hypothetical protein
MYEDGLYISHGPENYALAVIREDNGQTLWIRNFATAESALDIMEDNILAEVDRSEIEQELNRRKGYFSAKLQRPEDGYK